MDEEHPEARNIVRLKSKIMCKNTHHVTATRSIKQEKDNFEQYSKQMWQIKHTIKNKSLRIITMLQDITV